MKDPRVQAAWEVAAENYAFLDAEKNRMEVSDGPVLVAAARERLSAAAKTALPANFAAFRKAFRGIIDEETVPEGIPWAIPYEELEGKRKIKVPAKVKSVRGKLNVPRERFHLRGKTVYLWAGLEFQK